MGTSKHLIQAVRGSGIVVAIVPLMLASCVNSPTARGTAAVQSAPYMAVNTKLPSAFPEASNRGSFLVVNDCLVLKRAGDGLLLTPIFPKDSRLVPDEHGTLSILVSGAKVPLGKDLRLGGGYLDVPAGGDISLQRPVPSTCPTSFWFVGNVMIN